MAMDRAFSADYKLVFANEAVKGRNYFCPGCNGKLHFFPGTSNKPHFRHSPNTPKSIKDKCELYTKGLGASSVYDDELQARNSLRLILDKDKNKYKFFLKFPLDKRPIKLNDNSHIIYKIKELSDIEIISTNLTLARRKINYYVPLLGRYTIYSSNEPLEKRLDLNHSGVFEPFCNGPLIFKNIVGEFFSIPYRKIVLTGRFFIVSYGPLFNLHRDLILLSNTQSGNFHIYELEMPNLISDSLVSWFQQTLKYTLQPATCILDLVSPLIYNKIGNTFEVAEKNISWLITNLANKLETQRLTMIYPNETRKVFLINSKNQVDITLDSYGEYQFFMDQELTEIITIKFSSSLETKYSFEYQVNVGHENTLFNKKIMNYKAIELSSNIPINIYEKDSLGYDLSTCFEQVINSPFYINIRTLWSTSFIEDNILEFDLNLSYLHRLYTNQSKSRKVILPNEILKWLKLTVTNSNYKDRSALIYLINRNGLKVSKDIENYIKGRK